MPRVFGRSPEEPDERSLDRVYRARDIVSPGQEQRRHADARREVDDVGFGELNLAVHETNP